MTRLAKEGDTVRVHYTGKLEDGNVFDSSIGREPLEFKIGASEVISGFEKAAVTLKPGEKKNFKIPPEEAYGEHDKNLVVEISEENLPDDLSPEVGMPLQLVNEEEEIVPVVISEVLENSLLVDANHPLAGKVLEFELELLEIV